LTIFISGAISGRESGLDCIIFNRISNTGGVLLVVRGETWPAADDLFITGMFYQTV